MSKNRFLRVLTAQESAAPFSAKQLIADLGARRRTLHCRSHVVRASVITDECGETFIAQIRLEKAFLAQLRREIRIARRNEGFFHIPNQRELDALEDLERRFPGIAQED